MVIEMYDPQKVEEEILKFWEKNNIFEKRREKNKGNEKWSFIDGPITANFKMGIHHAAGRSYKDLYQRWKAMQGYKQRYQNGFDTQGLPIELQAEKELEVNSRQEIEEIGIEKFIEKCKEIVEEYSQSQTEDSIKLGQWMDWENSYYTYKDEYIEHVWHFIKKCQEKDLLEEGTKVLWWCPRCGTSLSQKEVGDGYTELTDESIFIKLPLKEEENANLMVWTTTPWTLSANVVCAVNPEEIYAKVKQDGEIYYMAKDAVHTTMEGEYEIKEEFRGEKLIGKQYKPPHPNFETQKEPEHKVIPWEEVGTKEGTGIVHIAPGCGEEDEELGKEHKLASPSPINESGYYKEGYGWLTGKYVNEVNEKVTEKLKEKNILYRTLDYKHQYPLCWRCDEKLIQRKAEGEWFIDQTKIKEELEREASKVRWEPEFLEKEYYNWLENMGKWIISRKRYWGTPLPIWKCNDCGETKVIESRKELEEKAIEGTEQLKELHKPWIDKVKIKCSECGGESERIEEVADCWMDSGLVPYATLKYVKDKKYFEKWFPADFITEMREQVNKWFHTTMVSSVVLEGKTPYQNVMTYSEVTDDKGEQMSKSKGNTIWVNEAVEKIGMENIRWTFIKGNPKTKTSLGYESGEEAEQELSTLSNINQYIEGTLENREELKDEIREEKLKKEDKWLLSRLNTTKKEVKKYLEEMEPHKAAKKLKNFFLEDFSRGYIQYTRERTKKDSKVRTVMDKTLFETLKLMAPFTPFITEKIYQESYKGRKKEESIHLYDWPEPEKEKINRELEKKMNTAQEVNETIRALRSEIGRGIRWPVKKIIIETKQEEVEKAVEKLERIIKEQTNVKELEVMEKTPEVEKKTTLNQKAVGAEFQSDAPRVMKKTEKEDKLKEIREYIEEQGFARLDLGTKEVKLKRKHINIERKMPENLEVREFSKGEIYLDKEMNKEMETEGTAREVMRHTQQMRKKEGLEKKQDIELKIKTDQETAEKLEKWKEDIKERTGAREIEISESTSDKYEANKKIEVKNKKIKIGFNVL